MRIADKENLMRPGQTVRCGRIALVIGLFLLGSCASQRADVGTTPNEQLCHVLKGIAPTDGRPIPALTPMLEAGAKRPADLDADLGGITLVFRTSEAAYDNLGPYRPAIEFTASLVELSRKGLIGPSALSPTVRASAAKVDRAVKAGAC